MKHLDEIRIMELAMDTAVKPTAREASHLEECEHCEALFQSEKELTDSLMRMPEKEVPDSFLSSVEAQFTKVYFIRNAVTPSLVIGFVIATLLASSMLWLVIANPASFTTTAAMAFAKTVTFFKAIFIAFDHIPFATEALTTTSIAMVLMSAALLAMISKKARVVK